MKYRSYHSGNNGISKTPVLLIATALALLVSGCNSSDDSPPAPTEDLSQVDNTQIRQSAVKNAINSLTKGASNTAQLADDPIPALDRPVLDPITGENISGTSDNQTAATELNAESNDFLATSLGLDADSQAVITHSGNRVTINPGDVDVCGENDAVEQYEQEEYDHCVTLAADVLIVIDADNQDEGVITYSFRGNPVLTISYAPTASSYELNLGGLYTYEQAYAELEGFASEIAGDVQSGAIRLSNSFDPVNSEVGKVSLDVTQPLRFVFDGDSLNLDTGTLLSVETFAGSGNGVVEMNIGALDYNLPESEFQEATVFNMSGLTGRIELTKEGEAMTMSNLSLGNGPVTLTVNSAEQIRMTMETLGFTIDEFDGELLLDTNLNFGLFTRSESHEFSSDFLTPSEPTITDTQINLSAMAGTGLLGQVAATKVTQGGPFSISINAVEDGVEVDNTAITVEAGQCFGDDENDSNGSIDIVPCDTTQ